ncbi:MAG: hypothetical protein JSV27_08685 [Candidatus Bathyarchaeota archaeon]|nr:MAG: hypothetical protein JSV27_08685 [Candidatus Bathyarchaeota archaeon]
MDKRTRVTTIRAILSALMIAALTWGTRYNWPDNVHERHGLPITWGVHTLVTIVGPVDTWSVNMTSLLLDLILWLALMVMIDLLPSQKA